MRRSAPTQTAAAKAVGVSARTFRDWVRRPDWRFGRRGPYDIDAVVRWRETLNGTAPQNAIAAAYARRKHRVGVILAIERARKLRFEREILVEKHILRITSDRVYTKMMALFHSKIVQWVEGMAGMFHNASRARITKLAEDRYDRICRELEAVERVNLLAEPVKREKPKDAKKAKAAHKRHKRKAG